ncbi:MAG: NAD(P)/FAD-dependent oxidoreductase [Calditrichaceae bacterium]
MNPEYDVIIVGGGPAGATAALYAKRAGLKSLLLDKDKFPRDKICGDAVSGKSMNILKDLGLLEKACALPGAEIRSITFGSPAGTTINIGLMSEKRKGMPGGMVIRREVFDQFLLAEASRAADRVIQGFKVIDVVKENGFVRGVRGINSETAKEEVYRGKIVIGADGFNSVVSRKTGLYRHEPGHLIIALRQYYKNVSELSDQIEIHYLKDVQPGYFWVFPLDNGTANVGIGMLHETITKRNIDLKLLLRKAITSDKFKDRFAEAEPLESPKGWNLPIASKHRKIHGNGFLLIGDAAGLIDPFTGEGIGNALYSAKIAVRSAEKAISFDDYSEKMLAEYDHQLWKTMGNEFKTSTRLQKIGRFHFLLNFVINRAARSAEVSEIISGMMANQIPKTKLANPFFYLKILFS